MPVGAGAAAAAGRWFQNGAGGRSGAGRGSNNRRYHDEQRRPVDPRNAGTSNDQTRVVDPDTGEIFYTRRYAGKVDPGLSSVRQARARADRRELRPTGVFRSRQQTEGRWRYTGRQRIVTLDQTIIQPGRAEARAERSARPYTRPHAPGERVYLGNRRTVRITRATPPDSVAPHYSDHPSFVRQDPTLHARLTERRLSIADNLLELAGAAPYGYGSLLFDQQPWVDAYGTSWESRMGRITPEYFVQPEWVTAAGPDQAVKDFWGAVNTLAGAGGHHGRRARYYARRAGTDGLLIDPRVRASFEGVNRLTAGVATAQSGGNLLVTNLRPRSGQIRSRPAAPDYLEDLSWLEEAWDGVLDEEQRSPDGRDADYCRESAGSGRPGPDSHNRTAQEDVLPYLGAVRSPMRPIGRR